MMSGRVLLSFDPSHCLDDKLTSEFLPGEPANHKTASLGPWQSEIMRCTGPNRVCGVCPGRHQYPSQLGVTYEGVAPPRGGEYVDPPPVKRRPLSGVYWPFPTGEKARLIWGLLMDESLLPAGAGTLPSSARREDAALAVGQARPGRVRSSG